VLLHPGRVARDRLGCRPAFSRNSSTLGWGRVLSPEGPAAHRSGCRAHPPNGAGHAPPRSRASSDLPQAESPPKDAYGANACFRRPSFLLPTPPACPGVCVVFGYRTLCTLRSSVRSTVRWRHLGPKPAASRSSEPVSAPRRGQADRQTGGPRLRGRRAVPTSASASGRAQDEQTCGCRRVRGGGCSSTLQTWCVTRL
jgi:hypothetical protein